MGKLAEEKWFKDFLKGEYIDSWGNHTAIYG